MTTGWHDSSQNDFLISFNRFSLNQSNLFKHRTLDAFGSQQQTANEKSLINAVGPSNGWCSVVSNSIHTWWWNEIRFSKLCGKFLYYKQNAEQTNERTHTQKKLSNLYSTFFGFCSRECVCMFIRCCCRHHRAWLNANKQRENKFILFFCRKANRTTESERPGRATARIMMNKRVAYHSERLCVH